LYITCTGTLTGNIQIIFPTNLVGVFQLDTSQVIFAAHSITLVSGSGTATLLAQSIATCSIPALNNIILGYALATNVSNITVAATGNTNITSPSLLINVNAVSLTGAITITFPGVVGTYYLNIGNITKNAHSITLVNGTGTSANLAVNNGGAVLCFFTDANHIFTAGG
jgi:hypothetical protein